MRGMARWVPSPPSHTKSQTEHGRCRPLHADAKVVVVVSHVALILVVPPKLATEDSRRGRGEMTRGREILSPPFGKFLRTLPSPSLKFDLPSGRRQALLTVLISSIRAYPNFKEPVRVRIGSNAVLTLQGQPGKMSSKTSLRANAWGLKRHRKDPAAFTQTEISSPARAPGPPQPVRSGGKRAVAGPLPTSGTAASARLKFEEELNSSWPVAVSKFFSASSGSSIRSRPRVPFCFLRRKVGTLPRYLQSLDFTRNWTLVDCSAAEDIGPI
ncbi:hypothetical protein NL676_015017 [Syzygium grande]|nr:hypothetical protein NL676_015017 [Syzygium grande]